MNHWRHCSRRGSCCRLHQLNASMKQAWSHFVSATPFPRLASLLALPLVLGSKRVYAAVPIEDNYTAPIWKICHIGLLVAAEYFVVRLVVAGIEQTAVAGLIAAGTVAVVVAVHKDYCAPVAFAAKMAAPADLHNPLFVSNQRWIVSAAAEALVGKIAEGNRRQTAVVAGTDYSSEKTVEVETVEEYRTDCGLQFVVFLLLAAVVAERKDYSVE